MTKTEVINKLLAVALGEVGYFEKANGNINYLYNKTSNKGSNNYTKYGYEMHKLYSAVMDYPAAWCDAFVDWCFVQVFGAETAQKLLHQFDDYTVQSAAYFKKAGEWHTSPQKGDQIFFKNSTGICHTGLVYDVSGGTVYTVEGNTGGNAGTVVANGDAVCKKSYAISNSRIAGYGRPNWSLVASENTYDTYLSKLVSKGIISDKELWSVYTAPVTKAQAVALIDKATGGTWASDEADSSIHWSQPLVISLCGKGIIGDKTQWIANPDTSISIALLLALVDNATGGMKAAYVGRQADHWGRNCLDSLCDKAIITTPSAWTNFEGEVNRGNTMALICKAFKF